MISLAFVEMPSQQNINAMNDLAEKKFSRFASLKLRRLSLRRPASSIADSRVPDMVGQRSAVGRASHPALVILPVATNS